VLKDKDYKDPMESLEKNKENAYNTLSQEEAVFYHRTRF
jgi:hypothetical protein